MPNPPYRLDLPARRSGSVVFASPHSGRNYPHSFLRRSVLDERTIRSSEDAYVDLLVSAAPQFGAPLLTALAPRAYVDLNRGADEVDPAVVDGIAGVTHNPRISSGLGVIPRVVANGRAIYRGKIPLPEARTRITEVWRPYHGALQQLLDECMGEFGEAILIDWHSMPHEAIDAIGSGPRRPEVVLGDRFGAACGPEIMDRVEGAFAAAGLRVARNAPFAGAYITQHYGRPSRGQHVVQVEIDRSLYMDERAIAPHDGFDSFRATLTAVLTDLVAIGTTPESLPLAAE